jgi:prepilin peptidase CpaA
MATISINYPLVVLVSVLIASIVNDLRVQKVPNLLTYPTMIGAMAYHGFTGGSDGLLFSLAGLVVGTALLLFPYLSGSMGAGEVKLMGASGAVLGMKGILIAFLIAVLVGVIYSLIHIVANSKYRRVFLRSTLLSLKLSFVTTRFMPIDIPANEKKPKLCYAVFIAFGVLFYVFKDLTGYGVAF